MDWREKYADKFVTPEEAVLTVKSGDTVLFGNYTSTPDTLCKAMMDRAPDVTDVTLHHWVSPFSWATPETEGHIRLVTSFATPADRDQIHAGMADYVPLANFRESYVREALYGDGLNSLFVKTSAPNENGYMSFGGALWANRSAADIAEKIICEVDERLIRTYGENFIHVSEVAHLVDHKHDDERPPPIAARSDEVSAAAEVICTLIANELVQDRDTLQIGLGDVSAALALYLADRHDIGIQTEMITGGVADMVAKGVITGKYKDVAPGKVVGTAFAALPPEELAQAHENPTFELWDFCRTDDLRVLVRETNLVAVNNALQLDLTGQVNAETLNGSVFSGPGGQTVFSMAASYSEGGRSIIALPSSSLVNGQRYSRILGVLPPGSMVTTPRTFVDYVVTEQGIASLRGKTLRQRTDELISVAHPDFKADLRKQASGDVQGVN